MMSAGQSKPKSEQWKRARTKNLSESQMKRAQRVVGRGRMEKVTAAERKAAGKGVDIGTTKWMTSAERGGKGRGGLLVDASGKAVTGTVTLPSGQSATYVRGKRIGLPRAGSAGTRAKTGGGGTSKEKKITPPPSGSGPSRAMPPYGKRVTRSTATPPPSSTSVQQGRGRNPKRAAGVMWSEKLGKWIYG